MANNNYQKNDSDSKEIKRKNKVNRNISGNINSILNQLSSIAFGGTIGNDVENLNKEFNDILRSESDSFNRASKSQKVTQDTSSFLSNLYRDMEGRSNPDSDIITQMSNIFDDSSNESSIRSFINEQYRNRMLKQSDLHEIASQLIELREAILITRDAIISSDIVEGQMTRNLKFDETGDDDYEDLTSVIESIEKKFNLQYKIKNFIIPKTLEYGEYYAYVIPYSKIFGDFMKQKEQNKMGFNMYHESTLYDFIESRGDSDKKEFYNDVDTYFESVSDEIISRSDNQRKIRNKKNDKEIFREDMNRILKNIIVCNEPRPITVLEEGQDSTNFFIEHCLDLSTFNEKMNIKVDDIGTDAYFNRVINSPNGDGIYSPKGQYRSDNGKDSKKKIDTIHDCYMRMIDPVHLIPIQIMTKRIGYYYIQCEEVAPETGVVSSSLYYNRFEDNRREHTIIDAIASQIVKSFDKDFLENNMKFKELIVEALNYYNLNEQRVRFQFIPEEYIVAFKVSEDENGNGTSMIEPSLFYAKLYLMLLLFKMMSIILYSNDQRINYIKTSGIDKNVRKKIEEIARKKQERNITVMDMFSYTAIVNKLGIGGETYIPTGKSGERGMETEIIQGQDIQTNSDLMDNLRKSYILGTGVPEAIMNYMNEADFAKSLELANTRFQGRVVSYQFDFNNGITELYKKILRWSSSMEEQNIEGFEFSFAPPKSSNGQIKNDLLQNFDTYAAWAIGLLVGQNNVDNPENEPIVRELKMLLAKDYLPMINFERIKEAFRKANIDGLEKLLTPSGEESEEEDLGI